LTHLLGKEIIDGEAYRWDTAPFITPLECHDYQLEWTRYVLMREETMLDRAGIYDLVFLSMFHYHIDTPWLRAFCERWNYSTNTLFTDDRELTPTLLEIQQLTGLPIFGHFYDEFMVDFHLLCRGLMRFIITYGGVIPEFHSDIGLPISPTGFIPVLRAWLPLGIHLVQVGSRFIMTALSLLRIHCVRMTWIGRLT
jgi:hypothetical protein